MSDFARRGWRCFGADAALGDWLSHAIPAAKAAVSDPANAHWLRCEGTWFAGVNILPNDAQGRVGQSGPLAGQAIDFIHTNLGLAPEWDRAQVSVTYPGYPRPRAGESEAAFRYRRGRDAAHLDGLVPHGPEKRRHLAEPHGFILGLPLTETDPGASPMVVWEGSHEIMRAAFTDRLAHIPPERWPDEDLTEAYHAARRRAFETCQRVPLHARPGEAYLVHRLALHGVSPWEKGASAPPEGRMIAYFRPHLAQTADWLTAP
ncbi:MAG: hypothetical protein HUJ27_10975 [Rhodobacteraceae bacterium]|nr:hypothetical protein [Paracoccaceae bacterium]